MNPSRAGDEPASAFAPPDVPVKAAAPESGRWVGLKRFARWKIGRASLTFRLSAYCAVLSGLTLACMLVLAYLEFSNALRDRAHVELLGERNLVQNELVDIADVAGLRGESGNAARPRINHPGLMVAVFADGAAAPLFSVPAGHNELVKLAGDPVSSGIREIDLADAFFSVVIEPITLRDGTALRLAVAIDRTGDRELLRAQRWRLLVRWVLGIILIGYLASIIARRSIAPLETFTARVATLSAGKLDLRVDTDNVPSELTQLAGTFNELLGRLDEAFARLDAFSTDIAHELRSPIANLMTRSEVTLSRTRTLEEYRLALESNAEEFERMRRMVEDMLFVARAENAAAAVAKERIDLAEVCETLAEYHSLGAEEAGLRIEVTGKGATHGDPMLIRRAVSNLLSNAIRHATAGSTIQLVAAGRPGGIQSIEVSNVGTPIPPELQRTVFDRFVRGDSSRQRPRDGSGTGLGLSIVRSIMKLHGGHVEVESGPAQHTLFRLVFPQLGDAGTAARTPA